MSPRWLEEPSAAGDGEWSPLIAGRVYFPDSSHVGWFDYASTMIGINLVHDPSEVPRSEGDITYYPLSHVTVVHESIHLLQAVGFPFFRRWCAIWRRLVLDAWTQADTEGISTRESLRDLPSRVDPSLRSTIRSHVGLLADRDEQGLSALALLESHAMLGEIWTHARAETPTDVCVELERNSPNAGYRRAFDIARLSIGDAAAIRAFPALVAAAFCFDVPVRAFAQILDHLSWLPEEDRASATIRELCLAVKGAGLHDHFLGLPRHQSEDLVAEDWNPLAASCGNVLDGCRRLEISLEEVLEDPELIADGVAMLTPTVLFALDSNGRASVQLGNLASSSVAEVEPAGVEKYKFERLVMVASQRLLRDCAAQSVGDTPPEYSWMQFVSEERLPLRIHTRQRRETPRDLAQRLVGELGIRGLRAPLTGAALGIAYLGHGVLEFATDSPLEVWQDPEVREIVRAISGVCPEFPLYLNPDPAPTMLVVWFGCLTDLEGTTASGFDATHPSAQRELVRFVEAVEECTKITGLNLLSLVERFLAPLTGR